LDGREPAIKGVTIYANPGGYDNLRSRSILSGIASEPSSAHLDSSLRSLLRNEIHTEAFGLFAFAFCSTAYAPAFFSISMTHDKFVLLD